MGFFSRIANKVSNLASSAVQSVKNAASNLKQAAVYVAGKAIDKLGSMAYNSGSTQSRVDVEKVLADFKEELGEEAKEAERKSIAEAMNHFDTFAEDLEDSFPELAQLVRSREAQAQKELKGVILDYVQIHISENDPHFQTVLEMQPGPEKQNALNSRMTEMIGEAESMFRRKLKGKITGLNQDLQVRLEEKLKSEEELLGSITEQYKDLEQKTTEESLDLEALEKEYKPSIEAASCIRQLLEQEVCRV